MFAYRAARAAATLDSMSTDRTSANGSRVQRLRELVARLEQLPSSEERDRVLAEVRARTVDVDTGETPRAMLPVDPAVLTPELLKPTPGARRAGFVAPYEPPPARIVATEAPADVPAAAKLNELLRLLAIDEQLSLEDVPAPSPQAPRRWERGLRG